MVSSGELQFVELGEQPADVVVDVGDHAVDLRGHVVGSALPGSGKPIFGNDRAPGSSCPCTSRGSFSGTWSGPCGQLKGR